MTSISTSISTTNSINTTTNNTKTRSEYPYNYGTNLNNLSINNTLQLNIGTLNNQQIVLPLSLYLHPSFFTKDNNTQQLVTNAYHTIISCMQEMIDTAQAYSKSINKATNIDKIRDINKMKLQTIHKNNIIFTYVWRNTSPYYHLFTIDDDNNNNKNNNNNTIYNRYTVSAHTLHVRAIPSQYKNATNVIQQDDNLLNKSGDIDASP